MPKTNSNRVPLFMILGFLALFGVCFLVGVVFLYGGYIAPQSNVRDSQNWVKTSCEILESSVKDHGNSYSVGVQFQYEFNQKEYIANRYDFTSVVDGGEARPRIIVLGLPRGTKTVCYVNPDNPSEAVIKRDYYRSGLPFPVVCIAIGLVGMCCTWSSSSNETRAGLYFGLAVGGVLCLGGVVSLYDGIISPRFDVDESQDWH